ncbi:MAG TPA: molybdate ABC transporter permease subunit [Planctomycetaceae bacterium]|nr:molybdate ABC transporter permease subunit [Planctomycetaceae bacterium]
MDWIAIGLTLKLALCTTSILFVLGMPLAYWLATTNWRGRFLIDAIVTLPLILPPTVLGFYLLIATGPNGWLGSYFERIFDSRLAFSFAGLLLGSVLYNLPFAVRPFVAAFERMDRKLIEASWCLGESNWRTFWRITFPLSWPGILSGLILTFAHCVGEFGVVLMIGGNIPGVTRTLSISIYDDVQALDYASAARTSFWLVLFSMIVLSCVHLLSRRGGQR